MTRLTRVGCMRSCRNPRFRPLAPPAAPDASSFVLDVPLLVVVVLLDDAPGNDADGEVLRLRGIMTTFFPKIV